MAKKIQIDRLGLVREICAVLREKPSTTGQIINRVGHKYIQDLLGDPEGFSPKEFADIHIQLRNITAGLLFGMAGEDYRIISVDTRWRCHLVPDWKNRVGRLNKMLREADE
jgi:hypothetical protein